jgi:hypothetical protein
MGQNLDAEEKNIDKECPYNLRRQWFNVRGETDHTKECDTTNHLQLIQPC